MGSDVTRGEHERLTARVGVLEREVEGEKMVTRHILEQTRRNSDDLAIVNTRLNRVEGKVDSLQTQVNDVAQDVCRIETTLQGLIRDLPKVVGDAVRSASPKARKR